MRTGIRILALSVAALLVGCHHYVPAGSHPAPWTYVTIRLEPVRSLAVSRQDGSTLTTPPLREITGRLIVVRGDTVSVEVADGVDASRHRYSPPDLVRATVAPGEGATVRVRTLDRARTAMVVAAIAAVVAGISAYIAFLLTVDD